MSERPTAVVKSLTPPEVADRLRTIDLRAGYIIGACKDTREMRLEAEEIKRLVVETFKGLRAWWHGDMAQSATEQSNAAPQEAKSGQSASDGNGLNEADVPAEAAPSETPKTDTFYYDKRGEVPVLRERSIHEDIEFACQLERARNAWEAKFNAECEKHDATTLRAMKAERDLALALDHIEKDDKEIERLNALVESNPSATALISGEISTAHVYRDAGGDMRIAIRYADATEEDRPATSFEVAVSAKISEIAASLQASHLPQNEKHG